MKSSPTPIFENHLNRYAHAHAVFFLKMVPPSTDLPSLLYLKGFWVFCVRADVSQCFHRDSTGADTTTGVADTTAGTAASLKNAERFTENSERFSENGERFILGTAISHAGTTISVTS